MSSALAACIRRFCKHCKRLNFILEDTKRCYDDINENQGQGENELLNIEMLQEEESEILSTTHKHPGILVLGQNEECKSRVVNEIFGRTIFPNFEGSEDGKQYRTVRFKYGDDLRVNLELPNDYSLLEELEAYKGPWNTIPHRDLELSAETESNTANGTAVLEVSFNHQLLRNGCTLIVAGTNQPFDEEVKRCIENVSPVLVYAFQSEKLSSQEIQDLELLKEITSFQPVCFVRIPNPDGSLATVVGSPFGAPTIQASGSRQNSPIRPKSGGSGSVDSSESLSNGYVNIRDKNVNQDYYDRNNSRLHSDETNSKSDKASGNVVHRHNHVNDKVQGADGNSENRSGESRTHQRVGKIFSTNYPPVHCQVVYGQLCKIGFLSDTPGMRNVSQNIIQDYFEVDSILVPNFETFLQAFMSFSEQTMQRYLVNAVTVLNQTHIRCLQTFIICAFDMARDVLVTPKKIDFAREKEEGLYKSLFQIAVDKGDEIREMIEKTMADSRESLINKAFEYDFIGVDFNEKGEIITYKGLKICTGQIQELVLGGLNQAVAGKLVSSVNILRDSYTGTLTRCLESLERVEQEHPDSNSTTEALKQMIITAYRLELEMENTCRQSIRRKMRKIVQGMPWSQSPRIDDDWKKKVAAEMLASLSATRLAKSISSQIKDRLNKSHDAFLTALKQLEMKHSGRLTKIEEERLKLRKVHAPRVAKVALESTSLKDVILYGMPQMGREIGRGQYGVVYSCDSWASYTPCAIKSVVPPDEKHWNDLALEFFYTKNIPDHDRVVMLRGSVIDYSYGSGTPAVLLIMDRLQRDLYSAIKQNLDWVSRLQVSIDVVEGIRFLHGQGLVHRDIKLKNVLLDKDNRGKITDLGFCKPEAMMSGSIVGTPIHMAPELFSGRYDSSVDVYAFGILFWYICAGSVRLPQNFEQCANKEQLWNYVKNGLRPEHLPVFDDECWDLMSNSWECEPAKRPLLGEVHATLQGIYDRYRNKPGGPTKTAKESPPKPLTQKNVKYKLKDKK